MPIRPNAPGAVRQPVQNEAASSLPDSNRAVDSRAAAVRTHHDEFVGGEKDPLIQAAMRRFVTRVQSIFGRDAMGEAKRAAGLTSQVLETSESQRAALDTAAVDLVKDLPVRAFNPVIADKVQKTLADRGVEITDIGARKVGSLGSVGGEIAQEIVSDFREKHPKTYHGFAAGVAVGGAVYAYNEGSDALKSLGVKPKVTAKLGQNTQLGASARWGENFSDFSGTVDATHKFGDAKTNTTLTGSVTARRRNESLEIAAARLGVTHRTGDASANTVVTGSMTASHRGDRLDVNSLRLGITHNEKHDNGWKSTTTLNALATSRGDEGLSLNNVDLGHKVSKTGLSLNNRVKLDGLGGIDSGSSVLSHTGKDKAVKTLKAEYGNSLALESMSVGYKLNADRGDDRLSVGGQAKYSLKADGIDASLSAGYTKEDLDVALTIGHNKRLGSYAGVGLKWSF